MPLLGGTIESPRELYLHKLGAALKMENTILTMLPQLEEHARDPQLQQALRHHFEETQGHVRNLEQAFSALGAEVDDSPCPAIKGLEKEGQANLKMVDDSFNDHVIISGVSETEHHEIAVYEKLITNAEVMGEQDVVAGCRRTSRTRRRRSRRHSTWASSSPGAPRRWPPSRARTPPRRPATSFS
jgi:ferritin-like metal-binding protein YciE